MYKLDKPANNEEKTLPTKKHRIPVFFHRDQLLHKPLFEWAFGEKIQHPETTSRAESILKAIESSPDRYDLRTPESFPLKAIRSQHHEDLITLYKAAMALPQDSTFCPSVFPKRDLEEADPQNIHHAGFYCFDSGTPLNSTTWSAAAWSAACAFEAAKMIADKKTRYTYSLCRPPGHHATKSTFGGYCYFNNSAMAAQIFRKLGPVLVVDIDFHHGNGTQSIFYQTDEVYTLSLHGDPQRHFPYFCGHESEKGTGYGKNYNQNVIVEDGCDGDHYLEVLKKKLKPIIKGFQPSFLVIAAGFDTYVGDPIGSFSIQTPEFAKIGEYLASLNLPTAIIQEGGYAVESLGHCVDSFLGGFLEGASANRSFDQNSDNSVTNQKNRSEI